LSARSQEIKSALSALFSKVPTASPDIHQLQEKLAQLLVSEKEHIAELRHITTEKEELSERMDNATHRYMLAEKKLDRSKSLQVAKLESQAIASRDEPSAATENGPTETNGVKGVARINEELEAQKNEAVAEVAKRKEQLEQLEVENKKLTEHVTSLTVKLSGLSDDDYAKCELFKVLKSQHEDVIKRINNLEATNVQLREEAQKLQAERTAYRIQIDEENRVMLSETETSLAQTEANLTRVRHARDEQLAENSILKANQDQKKTSINQIKDLASARESRIAALESEVERLRVQVTEQVETEASQPELEGLSPEELRSKIVSLESQCKLLSNELPSMEAAWKKAQAIAGQKIADQSMMEEQVQRATADKAKADQKYFAAMKTKEAREAENKSFVMQRMKNGEVIASLKESEALSRSLLDKVEKQNAEMKSQMDDMANQHRVMQQKLNEYQLTNEGQSSQITELKKIVEAKTTTQLEAAHSQREAEAEREALKVQLQESQKQAELWKKKSLGAQSEEDKHMRVGSDTVHHISLLLIPCRQCFCAQCARRTSKTLPSSRVVTCSASIASTNVLLHAQGSALSAESLSDPTII
jgi:E3 ubiquitin-protein ligase BRE1